MKVDGLMWADGAIQAITLQRFQLILLKKQYLVSTEWKILGFMIGQVIVVCIIALRMPRMVITT